MKTHIWNSPDGKIKKEILSFGTSGLKPTESSECIIVINDCSLDVKKFNECPVVIGDFDTYFGKLLDITLQHMCQGEIANVTFNMNNNEVETFTLELKSYVAKGLIYEWNASDKYNLAINHKNKGVELFKENNFVAASYRFGKALKILISIPIDVETPIKVDSILVKDLNILKATLYNNLASCFLKNGNYDIVIRLGQKALTNDENNVKAMYRCGIAFYEAHDFEKAIEYFNKILDIEPENKAAIDMVKASGKKLAEANVKVTDIFKKMFANN